MAGTFRRGAAALAMVASASLAATPAAAHGWGGGWGGGYRHRDRVDAGDIFAGILIIGGIAAIASAASKANKQRQNRDAEPDPRYRPDTRDYGRAEDRGSDDRPEWREGSGIDTAVNRCIDEVNRGSTRVAQVDAVNRDDQGWRVTGTTTGNSAFSCTIDRDGRIRDVDVNGRAI